MNRLKTSKKTYFSPFIWRELFLLNDNPIHRDKKRIIYNRGSQVPSVFSSLSVSIHNGKTFHSRTFNKWMVGYKFGEFSWTRKPALYKAKQLKKKKK